jgi:hypothetical protein
MGFVILFGLVPFGYWASKRLSSSQMFFVYAGVLLALVALVTLSGGAKQFTDPRQWIANTLILGMVGTPPSLFAVLARGRLALMWVLLWGFLLSLAAALILPLAAVIIVCAMGIDCI